MKRLTRTELEIISIKLEVLQLVYSSLKGSAKEEARKEIAELCELSIRSLMPPKLTLIQGGK